MLFRLLITSLFSFLSDSSFPLFEQNLDFCDTLETIYIYIYSLSDIVYIGHTKKQIRTRIQEHQHYISRENWDKSGAANHSRTCDGIQWSDVKTVCREKNQFEREVREALEIQRERCDPERGGMNVDLGKWVKTTFWLPFFKNLRVTSNNETNNAITSGRQNTDERSRPHSNERSSESNT